MNENDPELFNWHPLTHSRALLSESEALAKVEPSLNSMRTAILAAVRNTGEEGLTPDEYAKKHHGLINTIRRRFTDLWKDGYIRHHPELQMRLNAAGNKCVVWVEGEDPERARSRIERLRAQLMENGIAPCC